MFNEKVKSLRSGKGSNRRDNSYVYRRNRGKRAVTKEGSKKAPKIVKQVTSFAGDFAFGCAEPDCTIFIHKVAKTTVHAVEVKSPIHRRVDGSYYYDSPDTRGGFERVEIDH